MKAMAGNDVLLLQDGNDEPDFVSGEYDFDLLGRFNQQAQTKDPF